MTSSNDVSLDRSDRRRLAGRIDHAVLRPDSHESEVIRACKDARRLGFRSVCVLPRFVETARRVLPDASTRVVTVVDFPLGGSSGKERVYQALNSMNNGADELDIVAPLADLTQGRWDRVLADLSALVTATPGLVHKIIIETGYLSDTQKVRASEVVVEAGAEFIKTCTGYGPRGATAGDVRLIRKAIGHRAGIKASGGIRSLARLFSMIRAGADVIGTSSGVHILGQTSR